MNWFPRANDDPQNKRAGEGPLPLQEPGESLGGRLLAQAPRLGVALSLALLRLHHYYSIRLKAFGQEASIVFRSFFLPLA